MTASAALADVFSGGYAEARAQARRRDPEAIRAVARQFEAYFIEQMLKSMRAASPPDDLLGGSASDLYHEMFDHRVSLEIAKGQGIGFAELIVRQLRDLAAAGEAGDASPADPGRRLSRPAASPAPVESGDRGPAAAPVEKSGNGSPAGFRSPESFVAAVRSHARRAAERLGVSPRLLVAQAALETGWGAHMMQRGDGSSANNLFGIKASRRWEGDVVALPSLELVDGVMRPVKSPFRAYESVGESFDDYVSLIRGEARYRPALARATDPVAYIQALQKAGYATDPDYADKVIRVMSRPVLDAVDGARPSRPAGPDRAG